MDVCLNWQNVETITLENGMTVLLYNDPSRVTCDIKFIIRLGSMDESKELVGTAHIYEHLRRNGNKVNTKEDVDEFFNYHSTNCNSTTSYTYTNFYCTVHTKDLKTALSYMANELMYPKLTQANIDKEKSIILKEYEEIMYGGSTIRNILANIVGKDAYKLEIIGSLENIKKASISDIESYFKKYYIPNNTVLILNGRLAEDIREKLHELFDKWERQDLPPRYNAKYSWKSEQYYNETDSDNIYIWAVWNIKKTKNLLIKKIGNNFVNDYLFYLLREKMKCIYSQKFELYTVSDNEYAIVSFSVPRDNTKDTLFILKNLKYLVINEKELEKIKEKIILEYCELSENITMILEEMAYTKFHNKKYTNPSEAVRMFEKAKLQEVQRFINKSFSNPRIYIAGNVIGEDLI